MARILIAEDDESMRNFIAMALERAGHKVKSCGDGLDALAELQNTDSSYDLLLADIVMPGMDGIELSQKAVKLRAGLQVMFITGFAAVAMDAQGADIPGKTALLSKPFHLNDLVDKVETLLAA